MASAKKKTTTNKKKKNKTKAKPTKPVEEAIVETTPVPDKLDDQAPEADGAEADGATPDKLDDQAPEADGATPDKLDDQAPEADGAEDDDQALEAPAISFFKQYLTNLGRGNINAAMASLNNCLKMMIRNKDEEIYQAVFDLMKTHRKFLTPKRMYQGIASLPPADRAAVEIVITALSLIAQGRHKAKGFKLNTKMVAQASKSSHLTDWIIKLMKR